MQRILSIDGGGTKLNAVLMDENMNLLGRGTAGGTNVNQLPAETARRNMASCLDQVFAAGVPESLSEVYVVLVGSLDDLKAELEARTRVEQFTFFSEAFGGLLAGSLRSDGFLALSGTGSGVSFTCPAGERIRLAERAKDARGIRFSQDGRCITVGGRGPIAGDDGSGAWIGHAAVRAVMRHLDGWGEETRLTPLLLSAWNAEADNWDVVRILHGSPAPYSKMASLTRIVGEAAKEEDPVALGIVREAGRLMAAQTEAILSRLADPPTAPFITFCGGAWKTHPEMRGAFLRRLRETRPETEAAYPLFEHVCAGPVSFLLGRGMAPEKIRAFLSEKLPMYRVS